MKIGITSDCSSCLEYAPFEHKVKITRTTIHFGDEELTDGIDITADEFYEKLVASKIVPSTSAPTPQEIVNRALEWKAEGCTDVIHFPISFGLSAYGENLSKYSEDLVDGINLHVYDCHTAVIMEGYTAHYAEICANHGMNVEEIFAELKANFNPVTYLLVDDLQYLVKNGRLNALAGTIGSLMAIKPILRLGENGKIDPFEKVRTRSKAMERMIEIVKNDIKDAKEVLICIQHSRRLDEAKELVERLKKEYANAVKFTINTVNPTVGCHIGSGVNSISYLVLDNLKYKNELIK